MNSKKRSLKPYSVLVCEHISETIMASRHSFINSDCESHAYDNYINGLDSALKDVDELKDHLLKLRKIAYSMRPLPF